MQALSIGKGLVLLFLQGEVVSEYATLLERAYPELNLWCHAYSHGYLEYIPTTHMLAEGGYEAITYLYSPRPLSGPYLPGVEKPIFDGVERLMGQLGV
jgi:hypothetical protein